MLPNIHILGIQGSGKGTQSALLVKTYNLDYLGSGNLFRERSQANDGFGRILQRELQTGRLLPDAFLYHTVVDFLANHAIRTGLLGDGVIRTIKQLEGLAEVWDRFGIGEPVLINLQLDEETAQARIEQRRREVEAAERLEHHRVFSGKLLHRTDDNPKAIQERFSIFRQMTTPIIDYFDNKGTCLHLDAQADIETVHQQICLYLEERYPSLTRQ